MSTDIILVLGGIIMITRKTIIEYDVNEYEANEIYIEEDLWEETNGGDLGAILDIMYRKNGNSPLRKEEGRIAYEQQHCVGGGDRL